MTKKLLWFDGYRLSQAADGSSPPWWTLAKISLKWLMMGNKNNKIISKNSIVYIIIWIMDVKIIFFYNKNNIR